MRLTGTAPSSSKSPASLPNGSRAGRSRLVQRVRTVSASTLGRTGREERSTSERNTSVPSSSRSRRAAARRARRPAPSPAHAVAIGIERLETDHFLGLRIGADHFVDLEDLHGAAPAHVRHHRVFVARVIQQDGLGGLRKQVHDGRAVPGGTSWRKRPAPASAAGRCARTARSARSPRRAVRRSRCADPFEPGEIEEEEFLREAEIFLQQPVAHERAARVGQQRPRLRRSPPAAAHRRGRIHRLHAAISAWGRAPGSARSCCTAARRAYAPCCSRRSGRSAARSSASLANFTSPVTSQVDAHRRHGFGRLDGRLQAVRRLPFRLGHFHRPERQVVAGAEFARHAVHRPRIQHRRRAPASSRLRGVTCSGSTWNSATDMEGIGRR